MSLASAWWAWGVAAIVLAALEVLIPGFVFLGFAAGAALTGMLLLVGIALAGPTAALVFAAVSAVAYVALRRWLRRPGEAPRVVTRDVNDPLPPRDR